VFENAEITDGQFEDVSLSHRKYAFS
jgi:hypothetical protein